MKYIHKRREFKKIVKEANATLNSSDMQVEFGDTLVGMLINRAFGGLKGMADKIDLSMLAKKLDSKLASMLVEKSAEQVEEIVQKFREEESESFNTEEFSEEVTSLMVLPKIEEIIEDVENGNEEGAVEKMKALPVATEKGVAHLASIINETTALVKQEFGTELATVEGGEEGLVKTGEEGGSEEGKDNEASPYYEKLKKAGQKLQNLKDMCESCIEDEGNKIRVQKVIQHGENSYNSLKDKLKRNDLDNIDNLFNELGNIFNKIKEFCESCVSDEEDAKISESLSKEIDIILEEMEQQATQEATKKVDASKLKQTVTEKRKSTKITEEDLRKLEDKIKDTAGMEDKITGDDYKDIIAILMKAKEKILATKFFDEIPKQQKRYYDRLETNEGSRAISRKGYQTWNKKVSEIVGYYKELLTPKVKELLLSSLEKKSIADDYVAIQKEFLGVAGKSTANKGKNRSTDKNVGFVGVKQIGTKNIVGSGIAMEATLSGASVKLVGIVTQPPEGSSGLCVKFSQKNNIGFLTPYFSSKISRDGLSAKTDNQTNGYEETVFSSANSEVYYAIIGIRGGDMYIAPGEYPIIYANLSKAISGKTPDRDNVIMHNKFEPKSTTINITKLGLLVGNNDGKATKGGSNEDLKTDTDVYLSDATKSSIYKLFKGELSKEEVNKGRLIRDIYRNIGGDINSGILKDLIEEVMSDDPGDTNTDNLIKKILNKHKESK